MSLVDLAAYHRQKLVGGSICSLRFFEQSPSLFPMHQVGFGVLLLQEWTLARRISRDFIGQLAWLAWITDREI